MRISPKTFADLVQHVYGAPLDPGGWEALLTVLCATLESKSAALVTYDFASREAQMHAAAGADPALLPLYEHYSPKNPFMPAVAAHVVSGFVGVSGEFMPDRELLRRSTSTSTCCAPATITTWRCVSNVSVTSRP